jgi:hypothetical protein
MAALEAASGGRSVRAASSFSPSFFASCRTPCQQW